MESFYNLRNTFFEETPNSHKIIIRDNGLTIDEMWIKPTFYHNYTKYHFFNVRTLFKSQKGIELQNYFFENNTVYNKESYDDYRLESLHAFSGEYHPRIYRPILKTTESGSNVMRFYEGGRGLFDLNSQFDYVPFDEEALSSGVQQLKILIDRLESIFKNVHPTKDNWNVYGNEIRNLLILSCTEVEAQLKGVLKANGITKEKLNTNYYVKLLEPLRLAGYNIKLSYFPSIEAISPFRSWNLKTPTDSLEWYSAYNAVKHDRENSFHFATLINTTKAIAAVAVLLVSQYGFNIPYWKDLIGNFFEFYQTPYWQFNDCYLPPVEGEEWIKRNLELK